MRMFAVTLILFSVQLAWAAPTANDCRRFFNYQDGTNSLISYLESIADVPNFKPWLMEFYRQTSVGNMVNPISISAARVSPELQIHRNGFNAILENSFFDVPRLKNWAAERLAKTIFEKQSRADVEAITKLNARPMQFVKVHDPKLNKESGAPSYELWMMTGPVTQAMWLEVFNHNPSHHQRGDETVTLNIRGQTVQAQPSHPVENVNFWSAIVFANEMSKKMGLPAAYDLKETLFTLAHTEAEILKAAGEGALRAVGGNNESIFAERNSIANVSEREGFRLPTPEEFSFLRTQMKFNGMPLDDLTDQQKQTFAMGNETHAVGAAPIPATLNNNKIDDLLGNVMFWTTSAYTPSNGNQSDFSALLFGTHFKSVFPGPQQVKKPSLTPWRCDAPNLTIGLILVRTVKP